MISHNCDIYLKYYWFKFICTWLQLTFCDVRLCQVNKPIISKLSNLGLIPKLIVNDIDECDLYSQIKILKKISHTLVVSESKPFKFNTLWYLWTWWNFN